MWPIFNRNNAKRVAGGSDDEKRSSKKQRQNNQVNGNISVSDEEKRTSQYQRQNYEVKAADTSLSEADQQSIIVADQEEILAGGYFVGRQYWHALATFPSARDVPLPPIANFTAFEAGDTNFESLFKKKEDCTWDGGNRLKVGDKILVVGSVVVGPPKRPDSVTDYDKYIEITSASSPHALRSITVSVPPGIHTHSQGNQDVLFPNANRTRAVRSPEQFLAVVQEVHPGLGRKFASPGRTSCWDEFKMFRGGVYLGCMADIRFARQFAMNECDFQSQLTFTPGRPRRMVTKAQNAGFYLANQCCLFLKLPLDRFDVLNMDLVIDCGPTLNAQLASLADDDKHTIVMVDLRVLATDGLPIPTDDKMTIKKVLKKGPAAFPTEFTQDLAGACGWSNGHAHQGLRALCRNEDKEVDLGVFRYVYREPFTATPEAPEDEWVLWSKGEARKVNTYVKEEITDKIRHYPIPRNRSQRWHGTILTTQYRVIDVDGEEDEHDSSREVIDEEDEVGSGEDDQGQYGDDDQEEETEADMTKAEMEKAKQDMKRKEDEGKVWLVDIDVHTDFKEGFGLNRVTGKDFTDAKTKPRTKKWSVIDEGATTDSRGEDDVSARDHGPHNLNMIGRNPNHSTLSQGTISQAAVQAYYEDRDRPYEQTGKSFG